MGLTRIVTQSSRFSHSVPLLKSLHWLPVPSRIMFKLCAITYKTMFSKEPSYLISTLSLAPKPRDLRSSGIHLLSVPRFKIRAGTRAFSVAVPTLWNSFLELVKSSNGIVSFRHHLKTKSPFKTPLLILPKFPLHPINCCWTLHLDCEFAQPLY